MSDEWGPWIDHDGKGCPCVGRIVKVQFVDLEVRDITAADTGIWLWTDPEEPQRGWFRGVDELGINYASVPVIRYRIRRPRALLQLIDMVENLPAPVREGVDA